MLAKDVMSRKAEFLPPTASLSEAADLMRIHDYGRLIGTVTDRDITVLAVAEGKDLNGTTKGKISKLCSEWAEAVSHD